MFYCSINANVKHSWFPVLRTVIVACNGGRCLANMRGGFTAHAQISADLHVNLLNGLSDLLLWRSGTHAFQVQRDWTACNLAFKKSREVHKFVFTSRVPLSRSGDNKNRMFVARSIAADHKDLIHDVSYDFHGRRMATCSSDQSIKVNGLSSHGLLEFVCNACNICG